ncbi:transposase [Sansalvadorimonas sp. 2012CJ34-2]|uniref:Transposase n=1 Tax=Parendozoicomonas callyspongiae TaxID=2942213 RepID=A0ABT0PHF3_9GAMM|nr:transposase [Sansalvadorimonas sp. 2012CJ34-2]MCL6270760.1 transposase [Sansalvadorimonas sp. 2012CJ34-2]
MTSARSALIDLDSTPYYHCMARCVRRAFLCGEDYLTGKSYEHRKPWVVDRLKELASVFAIEVCAYAVMSNHYHAVLYVDRESCQKWSDKEVLHRWTRLFSGPLLVQRFLAGAELGKAELTKVSEFAGEYRQRLQSISWFMRCLNEHLARKANEEDGCKGRFWEGRYKSQALLDEAAVLCCMAYVDLNPVRAGRATTPERSEFTSIQERIEQWHGSEGRKQPSLLRSMKTPTHSRNPIPFALVDYFELVDWTGRAVRDDKRGAIPEHLPPILARMGIDPVEWLKTMQPEGNRFTRVIGKEASLRVFATRCEINWVHGVSASSQLFV